MQRLISALSLTVIAFGGSLAAQDSELFRIPVGSIDRYVVSTFSEQVESFQMDRLRLKGRKDILYEIIPDMRWVRDAVGASVVFENRWKPSLRYEVTSFPENRLDREFGPSLLKTYLNTRRLELAEAGIEILTPPEKITSGPAQFRILGRRAIFSATPLRGVKRPSFAAKTGCQLRIQSISLLLKLPRIHLAAFSRGSEWL